MALLNAHQILSDLQTLYLLITSLSYGRQSSKNLDLLRTKCSGLDQNYLELTDTIAHQLDTIAKKEKILEQYILEYTQANHLAGYIHDIVQHNTTTTMLSCSLVFACALFYFGNRYFSELLVCSQSDECYIYCQNPLVGLLPHLSTQTIVLNEHVAKFTHLNANLKQSSNKLEMHIEYLDARINYFVNEIEKCDGTNVVDLIIYHDHFIFDVLSSTCSFLAIMLMFGFIKSQINCVVLTSKQKPK